MSISGDHRNWKNFLNKEVMGLNFGSSALKSVCSSVEMKAKIQSIAESGFQFLAPGLESEQFNRAAVHVPVT